MLMQGPQYKKNFIDKRGIKRNLNTKDVILIKPLKSCHFSMKRPFEKQF